MTMFEAKNKNGYTAIEKILRRMSLIISTLLMSILIISMTEVVIADELTENEMTDDIKKIKKILEGDYPNKGKPYDENTWNCRHFSENLQKVLWEKGIETVIVRVKYRVEGEDKEKTHHLLKTEHKEGNKEVYIEPQNIPPKNPFYKGLKNALEDFFKKKVTITETTFPYPLITINLETAPKCSAFFLGDFKITVTLTDCNGKAVEGKDFTLEITKHDNTKEKIEGKTDKNGKCETKIKPCPDTGDYYGKHFTIRVIVPGKVKDDEVKRKCKCLVFRPKKMIWDPGSETWKESIYANIYDIVAFRCVIHNGGICNLTNITVTDTLPDNLEYANNSTYPESSVTKNEDGTTTIKWLFEDIVLMPWENITIKFDAHVIKCGIDINVVNITGICNNITVSDEDNASVICVNEVPAITPLSFLLALLSLLGLGAIAMRRMYRR